MKKITCLFWPSGPNVDFRKLQQLVNILVLILFLGLMTLPATAASSFISDRTGLASEDQQIKVTGTVTDAATANPMPGVYIQVKGTTVGAITDAGGKYSITVTEQADVLSFSFIGYVTQEIPIGGRAILDVALAQQITGLDEVIVVGYGTQKKVTATGSVVSTKGEELTKSAVTNLTNNLVGRMPGLTTVSRSGEPGMDGAMLRIRGSNTLGDNSPLIVVDGVPNRGFERLNPNDIESITVLKDASAAIYGSQAANGVILVMTKRGSIGRPVISIDLNYGASQPTKIPEMANSNQYASMLNEIAYYKTPSLGRYQKYSEAELQKFSDGSDPWGYPDTDWFKEVFKSWAGQNYQNVSISGGTDNMKYFLSLGTRFQDAIYKKSATNYRQYDFRTNIDGRVNKYINIAFDVSGREEIRNYPTVNVGSNFRMLMRGKPNWPAYWPNGDPGPDIEYGVNPAVSVTSATGYNKTKVYILESNLRSVISIPWITGLTVTANASFDKNIQFQKLFETPWNLYTWDGNPEHKTVAAKRGLSAPQLTERLYDGQKISVNAYAAYEKTFAVRHDIRVMAGTERRNGITDFFSAFRKNFLSATVDQLFAGATDQYMANDGYANQNAYMSYFGRMNYVLSSKYMLEFVWRYDGSYMFPESKRFGFFPALSAGWRISEENFWKNKSFVNDFKIRGSWGQTGNDRIAEYQYLTTYGFLSNRTYVFNGVDAKLLNETKIPNPNVTWEVANQANIGFDASLFNNKITVSADYFNNIRSQILIQRNASIPSSTGFTLPPENIGKVKNSGFEAVVGYRGSSGGLDYNMSINGSFSRNEILFWDETPGIPEYQQSTGRPMGSSLYYEAIGIFKDDEAVNAYPHWSGARPGDIIFKDVNSDGKIDGLDKVMNEKNYMPRFIGGLSAEVRYKGFDLTVLIQGATGAVVYISSESGEIGNYFKEFADNRWTPENINSTYPRTFNRNDEYWRAVAQVNTYFLNNMDYVRLKNFEFGYSLPINLVKSLGIEGLRLYVNGNNLFTLAKQKYIDPELVDGDGQDYPLARIISGGMKLTF